MEWIKGVITKNSITYRRLNDSLQEPVSSARVSCWLLGASPRWAVCVGRFIQRKSGQKSCKDFKISYLSAFQWVDGLRVSVNLSYYPKSIRYLVFSQGFSPFVIRPVCAMHWKGHWRAHHDAGIVGRPGLSPNSKPSARTNHP